MWLQTRGASQMTNAAKDNGSPAGAVPIAPDLPASPEMGTLIKHFFRPAFGLFVNGKLYVQEDTEEELRGILADESDCFPAGATVEIAPIFFSITMFKA